jgi:hypothetical protein
MIKKALVLMVFIGGILVLSEFAGAVGTSTISSLSQKQLKSQKSESIISLQYPVIVTHVRELYGTIDNPQYRWLGDVDVKIIVIPRWWETYWSGITDENGTTDKVKVELGILYKVIISKDNYSAYKDESYHALGPKEIKEYHVYFTMVEDGSPFVKQSSQEFQIFNQFVERFLTIK